MPGNNTSTNNLLPLTLAGKNKGPGYVYLAKFHYFKNHYKIGSTSKPLSRRSSLWCYHGPTHYIIYGYVIDKLRIERLLQTILIDLSYWGNTQKLLTSGVPSSEINKICILGSSASSEYFIIEDKDLPKIIALFESICTSTKKDEPKEITPANIRGCC